MAIRDESIESWEQLAPIVRSLFKSRWIFRGVSDAKHDLRPKIGRPGARRDAGTGGQLPYSKSEERRLLAQFSREAQPHFGFTPRNELELLAYGQHHGLPTRLLDWTESVLVAAFFAVENANPTQPAAIYGVECPHLADPDLSPFDYPASAPPVLVRPPHISPRITSQSAVFTLHHDPTASWEIDGIVRWQIPGGACFTLKGILNFCGIHRASLFPDDPDALVHHLEWLHKWDRLA
jgi:hypothetical protein